LKGDQIVVTMQVESKEEQDPEGRAQQADEPCPSRTMKRCSGGSDGEEGAAEQGACRWIERSRQCVAAEVFEHCEARWAALASRHRLGPLLWMLALLYALAPSDSAVA